MCRMWCEILDKRASERMTGDVIRIKQADKRGYAECVSGGLADLCYPSSTTRRGRVIEMGKVSPTLCTGDSDVCVVENVYRIRKLTPTECGRLMNVNEMDIKTILETNSNTQGYKQFGNSIVVACLCAVFSQLHIAGVKTWNEMTDDERYELIYKGCEVGE